MSKFIKLAEAQEGRTTEFDFTTKTGSTFHIEISVYAECAMIRQDGKYIGSVEYKGGKITIFGWDSLIMKKRIQLLIDNCEKEDSYVAPAWKQAIIDRFQKRVNDAQLELALVMKKVSNI